MQTHDRTSTSRPQPAVDNLPVHVPRPFANKPRTAKIRARWSSAWDTGGILHQFWDDIRCARIDGWHGMADWLKTLIGLTGLSIAVISIRIAGLIVIDVLHRLLTLAPKVQIGTDTTSGVWAVVDHPVRSYVAQHSAGLAISGSTVYTLWLLTGITGLIGGWLSRNDALRLLWAAHGTVTAYMVWESSPPACRTTATALAVLTWSLLSLLALRSVHLRRWHTRASRPARVSVVLIQTTTPSSDTARWPGGPHDIDGPH
ncbi:hypothetical protein AB0L42_26570 [Streptomyces sp. NPDC052287]|uniref:hypothetical protein n=1 Tax=Streptomyces sp. NPDC052287 TaxID=3154950 RepID=UPI0034219928